MADIWKKLPTPKKKLEKVFKYSEPNSNDPTQFWVYFVMSGAASYFWYLTIFVLRGITPHPALFGFGVFLARIIIAFIGQNKIWVDPTTTIFLYPFSSTKKRSTKSCTIWQQGIYLCILQLGMGALAATTAWGLKIPFAGAPSLNLNIDKGLGLVVEIITTFFLFTFLIHLMEQFKKILDAKNTNSQTIAVTPKSNNPTDVVNVKIEITEPYKEELILFMNSFAQGCVYALHYMLAFQFTGGALDFWQYLWPAAISNSLNVDAWWIYLVGPYGGAILAVILNYGGRRCRKIKNKRATKSKKEEEVWISCCLFPEKNNDSDSDDRE
jgi:TRAP-type C4-dicarboxylate transport system permease small subunit